MSGKRKRWILGVLLVYAAALLLLVATERNAEGATIHSMGDALWYSLVTMTTVGFGDLSPVTVPGRVISILFLGMSIGLFGLLLRTVYSFTTGRLVPRIRIAMGRNRPWYVFSGLEEETLVLAENLLSEEKNALAVFCGGAGQHIRNKSFCFPGWTAEETADYVTRKKISCVFFVWHGETVFPGDGMPPHVRVIRRQTPTDAGGPGERFDPVTAMARQYWRDYPIRPEEREILFAGDGEAARELLGRALLNEDMVPFRTVVFHVTGDWADFRRNHSRLEDFLAVNRTEEGRDSLYFRDQPWNDGELVGRADRIILCAEDQEENLRNLRVLRTWFPTKAAVHLLGDRAAEGAQCFGGRSGVFTRENVLQDEMNRLARSMHERFRREQGGPGWEELGEFARESNCAAADHLFVKARLLTGPEEMKDGERYRLALERFRGASGDLRELCRRNEHDRWMRFHCFYNWRWGERKDPLLRLHPCIAPFEQLSPEEQARDDLAWELLETAAENERQKPGKGERS